MEIQSVVIAAVHTQIMQTCNRIVLSAGWILQPWIYHPVPDALAGRGRRSFAHLAGKSSFWRIGVKGHSAEMGCS